ncbi:MAG TPA: SEC-C metal-binding domain-containing protein [Desulfosporosinus sp.]
MATLLTFPDVEKEEVFSIEEEDKGFITVYNEHPEVKTLLERRDLYPDILEINGLNPVFHIMIEGIIENQLSEVSDVREIYEKLQREEGLTPHAARASIARIFVHHFFAFLKEHKPFDQEAYVRRLSLIGADVLNVGRNYSCPCGSGAKFKRCCAPFTEAFVVSQLAGRLDLGYGSYVLDVPEQIKDPLDPIFQLEARYHISEYMEAHGDLEGALVVLRENITQATVYRDGEFLENAWQDYKYFCLNHAQFAEEAVEAAEQLQQFAQNDEEKGDLICETADLLAKMGNIAASEIEYRKLFNTLPDYHYGRYRYVLMLSLHKRETDAKKVLTELLADLSIDAKTQQAARALFKDLGM